MPRRTRTNPFDILNTKREWARTHNLTGQSRYRNDIVSGWENTIRDKIYPGWDKIYTVIDKGTKASITEIQQASKDLVFYKPPAFPNIRDYDTKKYSSDMQTYEALGLAELRNYIDTLNNEYTLMGKELNENEFFIRNAEVAAKEEKRYNEQRELENRRYDEERKRKKEENNYFYARFSSLESKVGAIAKELENQKKENRNEISFLQSNLSGMPKHEDLLSQSMTIQDLEREVSNVSKKLDESKDRQSKSISKLYDINESLSDSINKSVSNINLSITGIKKALEENSRVYKTDKEALNKEIETVKKSTGDIQPQLTALTNKLKETQRKHDETKTNLLEKLKEQQQFNQTAIEELKAEGTLRQEQTDRDISQLQREFLTSRIGFRTLWDKYKEANRQIKKQNQYKRTTKAQEVLKTQPDLLKQAFAGAGLRGRFFKLVDQF